MSDIPHAHNTPRSRGYTSDVMRERALHWFEPPKNVACGKEFFTLDYTDDELKWLRAKRRCKWCEKKHPVKDDLKLD